MTDGDITKRLEEFEGKLEELEDLELTNKIEILELKSILKNLQAQPTAAPAPGAPAPRQAGAPTPLPKDIVKALENLFKIQNAIQRRLDMVTADVDELHKTKKRVDALAAEIESLRRSMQRMGVSRPEVVPAYPAVPTEVPAAPVVGEIRITEIRSKIEEAKRLMGR